MAAPGAGQRRVPWGAPIVRDRRRSTSAEGVSLIVRCRCELQRAAPDDRLQGTVDLESSLVLIRLSADTGEAVERCMVRHIASGREVYVQSGAGLSRFIRESLRPDGPAERHGDGRAGTTAPGAANEEETP
jgi:hypothetical protein